MIDNAPTTFPARVHVTAARDCITMIESALGSRFYGLENLTKQGETRIWAIAPRPPKKAIAAITGEGKPLPPHLLRRWCAKRHAWRTVDLSTVKRIWFRDPESKMRFEITIER